MHKSVLVEEICSFLNPTPGGVYVDCTLGHGGTSLKILEKSGNNAHILGMDCDSQALDLAKKTLESHANSVTFCHGNFSHILNFVHKSGFKHVDGVVFDLGVSSMQLDSPERGFSFLSSGPLDMRMDRRQETSALDLVNQLPEKELADLIFTYGEERYSRRIARAIVQARTNERIWTTDSLVEVLRRALPPAYKRGRLHFATRTFQALRVTVNRELEVLGTALEDAVSLLKQGGRVVVVAFHSLEDRIVKHTFRRLAVEANPPISLLTKKPVLPSREEVRGNPRARSAKLRAVQRLVEGESR